MLGERAVHMTGREIDAYYRQQREENLRRYHTLQARQSIQADRSGVFWLAFVTVLSLVVCTVFLQLNFQVQQRTYRVSLLQKEVDELRLKNADAKKRIEDTGNLFSIQEKAVSYGMGYPKEGNVVYYTVEEQDYMIQTDDIPGS